MGVKLTSKGKSEKNSIPSYKAFLLLFIAVCGLAVVVILGVMPLLIVSPKESARHFKESELDYLYQVQVTFIPSQAFVVNDYIEVDIYIQLRFYKNSVNITGLTLGFPYTYSVETDKSYELNGHLEIELEEPFTSGEVTRINAWEKGTICYESEGQFDMILTVGHPSHDDEFIFPDVVEIRSYSHLEQLYNIQLTRSLLFMILGLLIISIIPAIDRLISAFFHPD